MRVLVAAAVLLVASSSLTGCLIIPEPQHADAVAVDAHGRMTFEGRSNTPLGPRVVAHRSQTAVGEWVVETYDSDLGACFDVVNPDGVREPFCEDTGGVDRGMQPVNLGGQWREGGEIGPVHYGIVRDDVALIRLEPGNDTEPATFETLTAPNVALRFTFVIAPKGWTRYDIAAYTADGCLVHREPYAIPTLRQAPREIPPNQECSDKVLDS